MPRKPVLVAKGKATSLEHAVCRVCDDGDSTRDDPLVSCACGLAVHLYCYGGEGRDFLDGVTSAKEAFASPVGAIQCALCAAGHAVADTPPCFLCGVSNLTNRAMKADAPKGAAPAAAKKKSAASAAMKRGGDDVPRLWAHITCVQWTPGAAFEDPENKDEFVFDDIPPRLFQQRCALCAPPGDRTHGSSTAASRDVQLTGAPLRCSRARCAVAFHVLCARKVGWEQTIRDGPLGISFRGFCGQHSADSHLQAAASIANPCVVCKDRKGDRDRDGLLCDDCDACYHLGCLSPPLAAVPEGDWYCPRCTQRRVVLGTMLPEAALRSALSQRRGPRQKSSGAAPSSSASAADRPITLAAAIAASSAAPPRGLAFSDDEDAEAGGPSSDEGISDGDSGDRDEASATDSAEEGDGEVEGFTRRRNQKRGRGAEASAGSASALRKAVQALTTGTRKRSRGAVAAAEAVGIEVRLVPRR